MKHEADQFPVNRAGLGWCILFIDDDTQARRARAEKFDSDGRLHVELTEDEAAVFELPANGIMMGWSRRCRCPTGMAATYTAYAAGTLSPL